MTINDDRTLPSMPSEEIMARRTKVMFLRNAGATWPAIAAETGVSEATARKDYAVVCRDINSEQPANVVARHRAVIFDIQRANYPAMMRGDKDAATTILKALDREAKLLGLDAPTRILAAVSGEEFANEAARLIARINQLDPATAKELERVRRQDTQHLTVIEGAGTDDGGPERLPEEDRGDDAPDSGGGDGTAPDDDAGLPRPARPAVDPLGWSNIEDD